MCFNIFDLLSQIMKSCRIAYLNRFSLPRYMNNLAYIHVQNTCGLITMITTITHFSHKHKITYSYKNFLRIFQHLISCLRDLTISHYRTFYGILKYGAECIPNCKLAIRFQWLYILSQCLYCIAIWFIQIDIYILLCYDTNIGPYMIYHRTIYDLSSDHIWFIQLSDC